MTFASAATPPRPSPPQPTFPELPFKERIRHEWNAVAEDWGTDQWYRVVEESAQGCNDRLVDLAGLGHGSRVLDVGTGVGEPAATAARRVGPGGRVLGIDLAPRMIEKGRRRMRELGLAQVRLEVGDIESLRLQPASFDAVLSRWTLMLMEDLGRTLADLHRMLVPGGSLAAGLWGPPERVPMISAAFAAVLELLHLPEPPTEGPNHLWLHGTDVLERLTREAGFDEVGTESTELVFDLPSPEAYAEFIYRMAGPVRVMVDSQPASVARELLGALAHAALRFRRPDGSVRFVNETILVFGRKPNSAEVATPKAAR